MSEEAALQAASEFVGEAFVFAVAGGLVVGGGESNAKDEKRRADAAAERAQLCAVIDAQHSTMSDMAALIEELMRYREESRAHVVALQTARQDETRGGRPAIGRRRANDRRRRACITLFYCNSNRSAPTLGLRRVVRRRRSRGVDRRRAVRSRRPHTRARGIVVVDAYHGGRRGKGA